MKLGQGLRDYMSFFHTAAFGKHDQTELARVNVVSQELYDEKQ